MVHCCKNATRGHQLTAAHLQVVIGYRHNVAIQFSQLLTLKLRLQHKIRATVILHTKLHKKHYQSETSWKVSFHVTGQLIHTCDGLEAHLPLHICVRVYEA